MPAFDLAVMAAGMAAAAGREELERHISELSSAMIAVVGAACSTDDDDDGHETPSVSETSTLRLVIGDESARWRDGERCRRPPLRHAEPP